jgi:hypothetical protein
MHLILGVFYCLFWYNIKKESGGNMKKILLLAVFFLPVCLMAGSTVPFLRLNLNASGMGQGGTGCADYGSISNIDINPASTNKTQDASIAFSYGSSSEFQLSSTQTTALVPFDGGGIFGISYIYSKQQFNAPAAGGQELDRNDKEILINYSFMNGDQFGFGADMKYAWSDIYGTTASFLSADLGMIYIADESLSFGLALNGLGGETSSQGSAYGLRDERLDSGITTGVDYMLLNDNENKLTISADAGYILTFNTGIVSAGFKYEYRSILTITAGDYENAYGMDYLTAGLGIDFDIGGMNYKIDYTYSPKVGGTGGFGNDEFITITALL